MWLENNFLRHDKSNIFVPMGKGEGEFFDLSIGVGSGFGGYLYWL